jgi:hypothetical protein
LAKNQKEKKNPKPTPKQLCRVATKNIKYLGMNLVKKVKKFMKGKFGSTSGRLSSLSEIPSS